MGPSSSALPSLLPAHTLKAFPDAGAALLLRLPFLFFQAFKRVFQALLIFHLHLHERLWGGQQDYAHHYVLLLIQFLLGLFALSTRYLAGKDDLGLVEDEGPRVFLCWHPARTISGYFLVGGVAVGAVGVVSELPVLEGVDFVDYSLNSGLLDWFLWLFEFFAADYVVLEHIQTGLETIRLLFLGDALLAFSCLVLGGS